MILADWPLLRPLIFALLFAALWIAVAYAISYHIGWVELAKQYRAKSPGRGTRVHIGHVQFRRRLFGGGLNNAMSARVNADGILLHMYFPFGINCPDLFVPWGDVSIRRGKWWYATYTEFEFSRVPDLPMRIFGRSAARIQQAAGFASPEKIVSDVVQR